MESWSDLLLAVLFYRLVALSDLLWTLIEYILVTLFGRLAWARRWAPVAWAPGPCEAVAQGRKKRTGREEEASIRAEIEVSGGEELTHGGLDFKQPRV